LTKSNFEIKKIIEADETLYKKFVDSNVHIESFIAASDADKKEFGGTFIQDVKAAVAAKEKEEKDEEESG
jgi:hypothetical protein